MIDSNTEITSKLDWLSITVTELQYPPDWTTERKELARGLLGYDTAVKYLDGRIELCSSTRHDMQTHVIFSGKCIDRLCSQHSLESLDILAALDGKCSRVDIAIDVKEGTLPILDMAKKFDAGEALSKYRSGLYLAGLGEEFGETLYVGSKSAKRRIRIYNKAEELGLVNEDWTRIELQNRSD